MGKVEIIRRVSFTRQKMTVSREMNSLFNYIKAKNIQLFNTS